MDLSEMHFRRPSCLTLISKIHFARVMNKKHSTSTIYSVQKLYMYSIRRRPVSQLLIYNL